MNISKWPLSKKMQLPEEAFGVKYMVGVELGSAANTIEYLMSPQSMPDDCVIWSFFYSGCMVSCNYTRLAFALGENPPNDAAQFGSCQPLLHGYKDQNFAYDLFLPANDSVIIPDMKFYVKAAGRRLLVMHKPYGGEGYFEGNLFFMVTTVPTEVPEWLVSDVDKNL